jgi:hypothetical protein
MKKRILTLPLLFSFTAATFAQSTQADEIGNSKYAAIAKQSLADFAKGDVKNYLAGFSDNAVFVFNNFDSIVGKPALVSYWTNRWANVLDSVIYTDVILIPLKVNHSQSVEQTGNWLLEWYKINAKYSTGKWMTQLMHVDLHFNANDKIDRVVEYIDRAPINAATAK